MIEHSESPAKAKLSKAGRAIDHFVKDKPCNGGRKVEAAPNMLVQPIDGCSALLLEANTDGRGELIELATTRNDPRLGLVHIYQVQAAPRSLRGWVYHAKQIDRLAFTNGRFKIVLHDLREDSPTAGKTSVLIAGDERKVLLTIAPFVAHAVENTGDGVASFVNLPTRVFDLADPDKYRLPVSSGLIPYPD